MPDHATLELLRTAFWYTYLATLVAASLSVAMTRRACLARATMALVLGSLAQGLWESSLPPGGYLLWWQHMVIDLPIFFVLTLPPRHYWQAALGGLVMAQITLHMAWGWEQAIGQWHWFGSLMFGFCKCAVLALWAGGDRVERVLLVVSRRLTDMVLVPFARRMAR